MPVLVPAEIHKLAGTALTLMGGLPGWLVRNQQYLPQVLTADASSLRSPDDKLARNAATTAQRLTSYEELAALLFAAQPAHVQALLAEYQRRGGLPVTLRKCMACCVHVGGCARLLWPARTCSIQQTWPPQWSLQIAKVLCRVLQA